MNLRQLSCRDVVSVMTTLWPSHEITFYKIWYALDQINSTVTRSLNYVT